ncbi:MAG: hypothetical protein KKD74_07215 [Bacteroidetes bacterium]|nr:hypothetical protein [Bacteroidota bacterium]
MKKIHSLIFVLSGFIACVPFSRSHAQSFEDFQQKIDKEYQQFEAETQQQFDAFVDQIDREFADFLKKSFTAFDVETGTVKPSAPKPEEVPGYSPGAERPKINEISVDVPIGKTGRQPRLPNIKKTESGDFQRQEASFTYFGAAIRLQYDSRMKTTVLEEVSPQAISDYWNTLSETNYNFLVKQLEDYRTQLNLNDWAYVKLVESFAATLYPSAPSMRNMTSWFVLTRSRYKAKIAFSQNRAYLLLPALQTIYGANFLVSDGLKYYMTEATLATVNTYKGDFPEADIIPDLTAPNPLNLPADPAYKAIKFNYSGKEYAFRILFNKNLMKFYETIPMTEPTVYFNSAAWSGSKDAFREALMPMLEGKSSQEAVALLLAMVQSGFEYKTDEEQFGREKYMFADELLYYRFSDCEDRAVLFSWLVKEILGLPTVGLAFQGHMASAVCFDGEVSGSHFSFNGCDYVVTDPTFVNAPVGLLMPQVVNQKPEIIAINGKGVQDVQLWDLARKAGAYKADKLRDVVFDSSGNGYICGYFVGTADFGSIKLSSDPEVKTGFVASYDRAGKLRWAKAFNGSSDNLAYSLSFNADGDLMVAGSFRGQLGIGGNTLEAAPNTDVFVSRITPDGQLKWASKAGIDKLNQEAGFMFSAGFDAQGEKFMARLYDETEDFDNFGLQVDENGNTFITGAFYATTGMNINKGKGFDTGEGFNPVNSLKAENDALLQEQYEQTIAGMFAAMKLIQINTLELPGKDVQSVFDKHNPTFVKVAPKFYNSFGGLRFMKNAGGIITIKTSDGKPVVFDKIMVQDNARIKVVTYKSGNARIEVFSGINISNGPLRYALNEVKLFKDTGDLLLGYDSDNTQIKLNLRKDMLKLGQ